MSMRRTLIGLIAALAAAFPAQPAAAQSSDDAWRRGDAWRRAETCLSQADTAACWLRLTADFMPHNQLRLHPSLMRRPRLLRSIGVEPVDTSRLPPDGSVETAREAVARRRRERVERTLDELIGGDPRLATRLQPSGPQADYDARAEHAGMDAEAWRSLVLDRVALMRLAEESGRLQMAQSTAGVLLEMGLSRRDALVDGSAVLHAAEILLPTLSVEERADLARRIESSAIAQGGLAVQGLLPAAHAAWIAADRPDEAERLIVDWTPRARAQSAAFSTGRDPDGVLRPDGQPSALQGLQSILVSQGRDAQASSLGWLDPASGIVHDLETGAGVVRLDERLAGKSHAEQRQILSACITHAETRTEVSEQCATRLLAVPGDWRARLNAAESALQAAQMAATLDEPERAERLARLAVAVGAQAERDRPADEIPMTFGLIAELLNIAAAMISDRPDA